MTLDQSSLDHDIISNTQHQQTTNTSEEHSTRAHLAVAEAVVGLFVARVSTPSVLKTTATYYYNLIDVKQVIIHCYT